MMLSFRIVKGLVFIEGNTRLQLIRKLVNGNYQLETEEGEIVNLTFDEMLKKWRTMEWVIDIRSIGASTEVFFLSTPADFASLPEKSQQIIKRRKYYLDAVKPEINKFNHGKWAVIIRNSALEIKDDAPPEATTVLGWWKRFKITKSVHTLLPVAKARKNYKTDKRYSFFEEVIKTIFLNKQKVVKINVVKHIKAIINKHNNLHPDAPVIQIATSTVYRWIDELEQDLVEASRLGAETARIKQRVAMGGLKITAPLARVELDHTPIDAIIIDAETLLPIGRPWLTLIIDVATRMILGFYISFNNPSAHSVLQALKMAIMPKDGVLQDLQDIKGIWPVMGIPILLVVDNGMDLHSEALKLACFEMGIQLMFTPAKTPFTKGSIERMIGTLNRELIHMLPGTVFSNISERGEYDAEENAAIDNKTLHKLIVKWIVEIYHNRPHKGLNGKTPLEVWTEKIQGMVLELPANPQLLDVITGIPATRTVFHYGIELDGLHYNSRELQEIRRSYGDNIKVQLKFYEDQVGFVHILDPKVNEYFRVDCVHLEFANVHRETYRLTRANARKRYGERHSIQQLLESLLDIQEMIKTAIKDKKMGQRKQAARLQMQDSKSVFEAKNKGVVESKNAELPSGLDDVLPDLGTRKIGDES